MGKDGKRCGREGMNESGMNVNKSEWMWIKVNECEWENGRMGEWTGLTLKNDELMLSGRSRVHLTIANKVNPDIVVRVPSALA
jgi:hypothetical protein